MMTDTSGTYFKKTLSDIKQAVSTIIEVATSDGLDPVSKLSRITLEAYQVILIIEETESIDAVGCKRVRPDS